MKTVVKIVDFISFAVLFSLGLSVIARIIH